MVGYPTEISVSDEFREGACQFAPLCAQANVVVETDAVQLFPEDHRDAEDRTHCHATTVGEYANSDILKT